MDKNFASLWEMYQAGLSIQKFTQGLTLKDYIENELVQSAVERKFEILGEAARRISPEFQNEHPEILWRELIGQRNIIAHQYEKVNQKRIWLTIQKSLPTLLKQIAALLPEID